jgi:hypothetical protein
LLANFLCGESLGGKREDLLLFWLEYYSFACMPAMVGKVIFLVAALSKNAKVDVSWFFAGGKGYSFNLKNARYASEISSQMQDFAILSTIFL